MELWNWELRKQLCSTERCAEIQTRLQLIPKPTFISLLGFTDGKGLGQCLSSYCGTLQNELTSGTQACQHSASESTGDLACLHSKCWKSPLQL